MVLAEPSGDYDSLVEYDRRRLLKEQLLYTTIGAALDTTLALNALQGVPDQATGIVTGESVTGVAAVPPRGPAVQRHHCGRVPRGEDLPLIFFAI